MSSSFPSISTLRRAVVTESSENVKQSNCLFKDKLPDDLFKEIASYLPEREAVNLSIAHRSFKELTIKSIELNRSKRLRALTLILCKTDLIPKSSLKNFCDDLKVLNVPSDILSDEQETKKSSESSAKSANHMQAIEQEFMRSLINLSALTGLYIKRTYFEEQRKLFKTNPSACAIDFVALSSCRSDFDLFEKDYFLPGLMTREIKEIVKAHGIWYLPILEESYDQMEDHYCQNITDEDVRPIVEALLNEGRLKKAVAFINKLIKRQVLIKSGSCSFWQDSHQAQKLHSVIMHSYIEKGDLSGALRALKTISIDVKGASICCVPQVISLALQKNDYQAIVDLLAFYKDAANQLNLNDRKFYSKLPKFKDAIHSACLWDKYESRNQQIAKGLKLIQITPEESIQIDLLQCVEVLFRRKTDTVYAGIELSEVFASIKRQLDMIHKEKRRDVDADLLSSFIMEFLKKEDLDLAFEFFITMTDRQKSKYVHELILLFIDKEKDYAKANIIASRISNEEERIKYYQEIKNKLNSSSSKGWSLGNIFKRLFH